MQVLDFYTTKGLVDVTPISLPGYHPNLQVLQHMYLKSKLNNKRQNELIPYNDCLYRNMYRLACSAGDVKLTFLLQI